MRISVDDMLGEEIRGRVELRVVSDLSRHSLLQEDVRSKREEGNRREEAREGGKKRVEEKRGPSVRA